METRQGAVGMQVLRVPTQSPPEQAGEVWHLSVRAHEVPFILLVVVQFESAGSEGSHKPTSQLELSDEQSFTGDEHAPWLQVPAGAQLLPPQAAPSAKLVSSQLPVVLLHVGAVWQGFWTHATLWATSATHIPLMQESLGVQASPSALQVAPSSYAYAQLLLVQVPVDL
jgi:hypothetical protein